MICLARAECRPLTSRQSVDNRASITFGPQALRSAMVALSRRKGSRMCLSFPILEHATLNLRRIFVKPTLRNRHCCAAPFRPRQTKGLLAAKRDARCATPRNDATSLRSMRFRFKVGCFNSAPTSEPRILGSDVVFPLPLHNRVSWQGGACDRATDRLPRRRALGNARWCRCRLMHLYPRSEAEIGAVR